MSKHTRGPLAVSVSEKWPFDIQTTDVFGDVVFSRRLPCYSTRQKNPAEAMAGVGLPPEFNAAEENAQALLDEVLRAAAPELLAACQHALDVLRTVPDEYAMPDHPIFGELRRVIAKATGADNA